MANTKRLFAICATLLIDGLAFGCSGANAPSATAAADTSSNLRVVGAFYTALGAGDGAGAARLVVPEKRASGPLSAAELVRFHATMRRPIRLLSAAPQSPGLISIRYQYVAADGRNCEAAATVQVVDRGGQPLIAGVDPLNAC